MYSFVLRALELDGSPRNSSRGSCKGGRMLLSTVAFQVAARSGYSERIERSVSQGGAFSDRNQSDGRSKNSTFHSFAVDLSDFLPSLAGARTCESSRTRAREACAHCRWRRKEVVQNASLVLSSKGKNAQKNVSRARRLGANPRPLPTNEGPIGHATLCL